MTYEPPCLALPLPFHIPGRGYQEKNSEPAPEFNAKESSIMKPPSIRLWYQILRANHHWTMFEAIRYALWLAR
jgi:hypothetical protein